MPRSWLVSAGGTRGHLSLLLLRMAQPRLHFQQVRQDCRREGFSSLKETKSPVTCVNMGCNTPWQQECALQTDVLGISIWGKTHLDGGWHIWMVDCTLFTPLLSIPGQLCSIRKQN